MDFDSVKAVENREIYCRKLGHHLPFSYCRQEGQKNPCASIRRCWQDRLDIDAYLKENFRQEEVRNLDQSPSPRLSGILEIVQKVMNNQ